MQHWWCGHFATDPKIRLEMWRESSALFFRQELFQGTATGSCARDQGLHHDSEKIDMFLEVRAGRFSKWSLTFQKMARRKCARKQHGVSGWDPIPFQ